MVLSPYRRSLEVRSMERGLAKSNPRIPLVVLSPYRRSLEVRGMRRHHESVT